MTRGASVKVVPWNYDFNVDVEKGGKQAFQLFLLCLSWKSFVCSSLYANFKFERLQNTLEQQSCCCKTPSCNHFVLMAIRKSFGHIIITIFNYLIQCINLQSVMVFS